MVKAVTKVVYKPDTQSTDEFIAIVNPAEYKKWKEGDTSIPLAQVVDSFEVFFSNQGAQGILGRPSRQQLENVFGTSKDIDVVMKVLQWGKDQPGSGFTTGVTATNASRTSAVIDNKGNSLTGI
ncbi:hypothetical protein SCLCIDRAFT_20232 [Scleroderma citrinum Foug A]|uniref:Ribosome maturation protein SDO1/SBDS N-terminal domain-containing protein n=1 Tax=Scleroderma citrinum Foug A TaxID=1036808 RepID=A0A0C3E866_9AGAM|nr:hypothetical protein SCLCIDRAFT_20232 [Scleroderma citrinum Foug A]